MTAGIIAKFDLLMGVQFFDLLYQKPGKIDLVETGKIKKGIIFSSKYKHASENEAKEQTKKQDR